VLGRSGDADVKLEGKLCSRKHAAIGFDPHKEHVYLSDLSSAHGTYVDEKRLEPSEKKRLKIGQEIWFGNADGEPRYTVHAVCSRKRAREDDDGSKTHKVPRDHAHPPASVPHSAAHARHVHEPPAAGGAGKTPFWKNGGSDGNLYIHTHTYIYIYIIFFTDVYVYVYVYVYVHVDILFYIYIYTRNCVYVWIYMFLYLQGQTAPRRTPRRTKRQKTPFQTLEKRTRRMRAQGPPRRTPASVT
jgi:hypothetical protein